MAINEHRTIWEKVVRDEEPFFPTRTFVDLERVGMNLRLEEGGGSSTVGERENVVARAVVVYSWDGE